MSVTQNLTDNDTFGSGVDPLDLQITVKNTFEIYRCKAESINSECKEAKEVIDRLKNEINEYREMEKTQRLKLSSLESKLKVLEGKRKLYYTLSERQKRSEETEKNVEEKISLLNSSIHEVKEKCQTLMERMSSALDFKERERSRLESVSHEKNVMLIALRRELEFITKEKADILQSHEEQIRKLKEELEISKLSNEESKDFFAKSVESYRKRIMSCEKTILEMERERRSILGDYEECSKETRNSNFSVGDDNSTDAGYAWPDSTVTCFSADREKNASITESDDITLGIGAGGSGTQSKQTERNANNRTTDCPKNNEIHSLGHQLRENKWMSNVTRRGTKQKPPLDFVDVNRHSLKAESQTKRRLYSENDDYYFS